MTSRLRILRLVVTGPSGRRSAIKFEPGLNVVQGAANTGKSHVVALINFMLGASSPPIRIPEQEGFAEAFLTLQETSEHPFTLARMLVGGDFRLASGFTDVWPLSGQSLAAKHKSDGSSLSEFLLAKLAMTDRRLRKNARGETQALSFRNLAHLSIVPEGKIQSETSPVETGQYVSRTSDFSAFKYLLTGHDDRLMAEIHKQKPDASRRAHQLELIDRQLIEVATQIEKSTSDPDDLPKEEERISGEIAEELARFEPSGIGFRELTAQRRDLRKRREKLLDRNDEIVLLATRFRLLDDQYTSDVARLESIAEAGTFFLLRSADLCPVCGALPEHQHSASCEGDVEAIRAAAQIEIARINVRRLELSEVSTSITLEAGKNLEEIAELDDTLTQLESSLATEMPDFRGAKERINNLISTRSMVQRSLSLVQRQRELQMLRNDLGDGETDATSLIAEASVSPEMKDSFSQTVQQLLEDWGYPTEGRVFFDLKTRDIEIGGKPRKANGKGVRAVLHAAFSIGLARHCYEKHLPHPGFVILDSPLVTYKDPIEANDIKLAETDLKSRFFNSLRALPPELQVIVFENVDLPAWLVDAPGTTIFTGSGTHGRQGFYAR